MIINQPSYKVSAFSGKEVDYMPTNSGETSYVYMPLYPSGLVLKGKLQNNTGTGMIKWWTTFSGDNFNLYIRTHRVGATLPLNIDLKWVSPVPKIYQINWKDSTTLVLNPSGFTFTDGWWQSSLGSGTITGLSEVTGTAIVSGITYRTITYTFSLRNINSIYYVDPGLWTFVDNKVIESSPSQDFVDHYPFYKTGNGSTTRFHDTTTSLAPGIYTFVTHFGSFYTEQDGNNIDNVWSQTYCGQLDQTSTTTDLKKTAAPSNSGSVNSTQNWQRINLLTQNKELYRLGSFNSYGRPTNGSYAVPSSSYKEVGNDIIVTKSTDYTKERPYIFFENFSSNDRYEESYFFKIDEYHFFANDAVWRCPKNMEFVKLTRECNTLVSEKDLSTPVQNHVGLYAIKINSAASYDYYAALPYSAFDSRTPYQGWITLDNIWLSEKMTLSGDLKINYSYNEGDYIYKNYSLSGSNVWNDMSFDDNLWEDSFTQGTTRINQKLVCGAGIFEVYLNTTLNITVSTKKPKGSQQGAGITGYNGGTLQYNFTSGESKEWDLQSAYISATYGSNKYTFSPKIGATNGLIKGKTPLFRLDSWYFNTHITDKLISTGALSFKTYLDRFSESTSIYFDANVADTVATCIVGYLPD